MPDEPVEKPLAASTGKGTAPFSAYCPASEPAASATARTIHARAARMPDDAHPDLRGVHVLVVDDNADARLILGTYLEYLGATVTTARNAGDALAAITDVRAHVIISDISMPGMDGIEMLKRIRNMPSERSAPTPAIAFSGFADRSNQAAARHAGFAAFFPKPADPLDVAREVQRLLRRGA